MSAACLPLLGLLFAACNPAPPAGAVPGTFSPESPGPAVAQVEPRPPTTDNRALTRPVELKELRLRKLEGELAELAPRALRGARGAFVIEAHTAEPIDLRVRTSWPVILLNDKPVANTRISPRANGALLAFVPDRSQIKKERNTVAVVWVGNEEQTRTTKPLVFSAEQVPAP